jgi:hypothetical protein
MPELLKRQPKQQKKNPKKLRVDHQHRKMGENQSKRKTQGKSNLQK